MKTNLLPIATFTAAIAALLILPVSPGAAGVLFAVPGIVSIFFLEYGSALKPIRVQAEIRPFDPVDRSQMDIRRAA